MQVVGKHGRGTKVSESYKTSLEIASEETRAVDESPGGSKMSWKKVENLQLVCLFPRLLMERGEVFEWAGDCGSSGFTQSIDECNCHRQICWALAAVENYLMS